MGSVPDARGLHSGSAQPAVRVDPGLARAGNFVRDPFEDRKVDPPLSMNFEVQLSGYARCT